MHRSSHFFWFLAAVVLLGCQPKSDDPLLEVPEAGAEAQELHVVVLDDASLAAAIRAEWESRGEGAIDVRAAASAEWLAQPTAADLFVFPGTLTGDFVRRAETGLVDQQGTGRRLHDRGHSLPGPCRHDELGGSLDRGAIRFAPSRLDVPSGSLASGRRRAARHLGRTRSSAAFARGATIPMGSGGKRLGAGRAAGKRRAARRFRRRRAAGSSRRLRGRRQSRFRTLVAEGPDLPNRLPAICASFAGDGEMLAGRGGGP